MVPSTSMMLGLSSGLLLEPRARLVLDVALLATPFVLIVDPFLVPGTYRISILVARPALIPSFGRRPARLRRRVLGLWRWLAEGLRFMAYHNEFGVRSGLFSSARDG